MAVLHTYILKVKKLTEPLFQSKNLRKKCVNQILKTEVCKSRHQAHRTQRVHIGKNISVIFSMIHMEV